MGQKKQTRDDFISQVLRLFVKYQETTKAILDDYVADKAMVVELSEAEFDFTSAVEELEADEFETVLRHLEKIKDNQNYRELDEEQCKALMELLADDFKIDYIDEELEKDNYVKVKVAGIMDQVKLEEFINRELEPYNTGYNHEITF
jgi:hypothetical protein